MVTIPQYSDGQELPVASWNLVAATVTELSGLLTTTGLTFAGAATVETTTGNLTLRNAAAAGASLTLATTIALLTTVGLTKLQVQDSSGGSAAAINTFAFPIRMADAVSDPSVTGLAANEILVYNKAGGLHYRQQGGTVFGPFVQGGANLGAGTAIFSGNVAQTLQFKSLVAAGDLTATSDATTVTITGFTWNTVTGATTAAANNGYIANSASRVPFTLPANPAVGSIVKVVGRGTGGWRVTPNTGQVVNFGTSIVASQAGGTSFDSTYQYDEIECIYLGANSWAVASCIGNIRLFPVTSLTNSADAAPYVSHHQVAKSFTYPAAGGATFVAVVGANTVYEFASFPNGSVTNAFILTGKPESLAPFTVAARLLKIRVYYSSNTAGAGNFDLTIKWCEVKTDAVLNDFVTALPTHTLPDAPTTQDLLVYEATTDVAVNGPAMFEFKRTGGTTTSALRILGIEFVYANR